mgnify:FL=1
MNILEEIKDAKKYNLHSHTEFCDGRAQMIAFAAKAVKSNFDVYGFSPHSPVPIISSCNMLKDNAERYLNQVKEIQHQYSSAKTRFFAGMEIDFLGKDWGPSHPYFDSLNLDYRIGSVHFIPDFTGELIDVDGHYDRFMQKMHDNFRNDIRYVVETFYAHSIEMVNAGGFDIIGHFDKIGDNSSHFKPGIEDEPWYQSLVNELIDVIIAKKPIVEINTKVYAQRGRLFPSERYWDKLIQGGVNIIVSSDAHVPALIDASLDDVKGLLAKHYQ